MSGSLKTKEWTPRKFGKRIESSKQYHAGHHLHGWQRNVSCFISALFPLAICEARGELAPVITVSRPHAKSLGNKAQRMLLAYGHGFQDDRFWYALHQEVRAEQQDVNNIDYGLFLSRASSIFIMFLEGLQITSIIFH